MRLIAGGAVACVALGVGLFFVVASSTDQPASEVAGNNDSMLASFGILDEESERCRAKWASSRNDGGRSMLVRRAETNPDSPYVSIGPSASFPDLCEAIIGFPALNTALRITERKDDESGGLFYPNPGAEGHLPPEPTEPIVWNAFLGMDGGLSPAIDPEMGPRERPTASPAYCVMAWNDEANYVAKTIARDVGGGEREATALPDPWFPDRCIVTVGIPQDQTVTQFREARMVDDDTWTPLSNPVPIGTVGPDFTDWNSTLNAKGLLRFEPDALGEQTTGKSLTDIFGFTEEASSSISPQYNPPHPDMVGCGGISLQPQTDWAISSVQTMGTSCTGVLDAIFNWLRDGSSDSSPEGNWSCHKVFRTEGMAMSKVTCTVDGALVAFNYT